MEVLKVKWAYYWPLAKLRIRDGCPPSFEYELATVGTSFKSPNPIIQRGPSMHRSVKRLLTVKLIELISFALLISVYLGKVDSSNSR